MTVPDDRTARPGPPPDLLPLLEEASAGDKGAAARLLPFVYDELRALAARYLRTERAGHTLQPTALVHEAYVRLVGAKPISFAGRTHFFTVAARLMREVLVDHARRRGAAKRGGALSRVTLHDALAITGDEEARQLDLLQVGEAMERLERLDPRQARVVELRVFGGFTIAETAGLLGMSTDTVEDDWAMARAWLARALGGG